MMYMSEKSKTISIILFTIGITSIAIGISLIFYNYSKTKYSNNTTPSIKNIYKSTDNQYSIISYTSIPTYNQAIEGYTLGCEGISLYMALTGLGYAHNYSIDEFMSTMPSGKTPFDGFMGNPKIGHVGSNVSKRTTIYPQPLTQWARNYASANDLTGASIETIKKELIEGHIILVYVTTGWKSANWKKYSWSKNDKGEIENNHCLCVVGFNSKGDFLVNDCHDGRIDGRYGEYWVNGDLFASIYNLRKYAISVY